MSDNKYELENSLKSDINSNLINPPNEKIDEKIQVSKTNLIVNYLPHTVTQAEMCSLFSNIGKVDRCRLIRDKNTGQSLGYGFVNFRKAEDACKAVHTLNGLRLQNKVLKVSHARPCSEDIKGANLHVSKLPKDMTEQDIANLFSPYGWIISLRLLHDSVTGLSKGIGFVRYNQRTEAETAIQELNGSVLNGADEGIAVKFANNTDVSSLTVQRFSSNGNYNLHNYAILIPLYKMNPGWCLFVYNLAPDITEGALWELFGAYGAVQKVNVVREADSKKSKGYAFVTMIEKDQAMIAIQSLNYSVFQNRILQVRFKDAKWKILHPYART